MIKVNEVASWFEARKSAFVKLLTDLVVQLGTLGAELRACAPPDKKFAELLARVGVAFLLIGVWR